VDLALAVTVQVEGILTSTVIDDLMLIAIAGEKVVDAITVRVDPGTAGNTMTKNGKRELLEAIRPRYLRASTTEKTHILDEFVTITGYHRKYAIRLLKHGRKQPRREKRGRSKVYQGKVVSALIKVWEVCDRICSRRLHPFLPEIVTVLEREGELVLSEETKGPLLHMSRASMDRCLQSVRYQRRRGRSTTKPGTLLKQAIPVRTFADWDYVRPGFVEMDLVAHGGDSAHLDGPLFLANSLSQAWPARPRY
jgi:hypothetical protein